MLIKSRNSRLFFSWRRRNKTEEKPGVYDFSDCSNPDFYRPWFRHQKTCGRRCLREYAWCNYWGCHNFYCQTHQGSLVRGWESDAKNYQIAKELQARERSQDFPRNRPSKVTIFCQIIQGGRDEMWGLIRSILAAYDFHVMIEEAGNDKEKKRLITRRAGSYKDLLKSL